MPRIYLQVAPRVTVLIDAIESIEERDGFQSTYIHLAGGACVTLPGKRHDEVVALIAKAFAQTRAV